MLTKWVNKWEGKNFSKPKIIPYNAIATIRKLGINRKSGQDMTDPNGINKGE